VSLEHGPAKLHVPVYHVLTPRTLSSSSVPGPTIIILSLHFLEEMFYLTFDGGSVYASISPKP
jgi:hypothetical protein